MPLSAHRFKVLPVFARVINSMVLSGLSESVGRVLNLRSGPKAPQGTALATSREESSHGLGSGLIAFGMVLAMNRRARARFSHAQ